MFFSAAGRLYGFDQSMAPIPPIADTLTPNLYGLLNPQMQLNNNQNVPANFRGTPTVPLFPSLIPSSNTPQTPISSAVNSVPSSTPVFNKAFNNTPVEKGPPVNVVITSSDPVPISFKTTQSQSPMVITIPPEHIKSSATKTTSFITESAKQPIISPFAPKSTTQPLSNISTFENSPTFFKMSSTENKNLPNIVETKPFTFKTTTTNEDKNGIPDTDNTVDKSTSSNYEEEPEYDPRPDFQPIIPLPAEIEVRTGEEDEECLFSNRAKLFRHSGNEWKERGIGIIKILKNKENKCRILMRREQIHKICANHVITNEMTLTVPDKETKGYIWIANDFADEVLSKEKLFVRFKTSDVADEFFKVFKKVSESAEPSPVKQDPPPPAAPKTTPVLPTLEKKTFTFSMNKKESTATPSPFANLNFGSSSANKTENTATPTPFANLSFGTPTLSIPTPTPNQVVDLNKSEEIHPEDDYVPTAEFTPVIPLPDLVEVVTGEENDKVLYSHRAKLFRFDKASNDWKERGIGDIKILQNKNDLGKIRLVMRREVIHKLCCNQRIYKNTQFKFLPNKNNAVMWVGPDYSENELAIETLTLRFKNESICAEFLKAIENAQSFIVTEQEDDDDDTGSENVSSDNSSSFIATDPSLAAVQDFGDKFKVKAGSWDCDSCYVRNDGANTSCLACNTPKEKPTATTKPTTTNGAPPLASGFGDKFKPAAGSWNCKDCYLSNPGTEIYCQACEAPKNDSVPKKEPKSLVLEKPKTTFSFGFGNNNANTNTSTDTNASSSSFSFGANKGVPATFGFGTANETAPKLAEVSPSSTPAPFTFTLPQSTVKVAEESQPPAPVSNAFNFTLPSTNSSFSFQMKPKSPGKNKHSPSKGLDGSDGEDEDEVYEEEENNTYFTPVIPLPDKVSFCRQCFLNSKIISN